MGTKENVYLCDLGSGSNMNLLPLAIGLVGSYAAAQPEIEDFFNLEYRFLRQSGNALAASMDNPAVVGFSSYVWNFRGSLAAAKGVKEAFPDTTIVFGGFSVPKLHSRIADFYKQYPFVDVLIHGEGELTFSDLLRERMTNREYHKLRGLSFRTLDVSDGFISNTEINRVQSLDDLPSPFLNGMFDDIMDTYGSAVTGALWETNRGCPYACTFCDWGNSDVRKVAKYDMGRLHEEIKWISRHQFYYMFFSDANFGIFKERDLEIAGYIADCHEKNGSPHHVVTNWAKHKGEQVVTIAERFAKGGVASNITMAIQSTNPATLKAIKRTNLAQGKMDQLKAHFHDRYIPTYVEVILGLPLESYDTFSKGLNQIISNRLEDRFFVYLCQMLENSELADPESREQYALDTRWCRHTVSNRKFEWSDEFTEYEEFVVGTSTMPVPDWVRSYVLGYFFTVLYNHRAAIFPIMYLKTEFGIEPIEFMEFVIESIRMRPEALPALSRSIAHIDRQAQLMLDGESSMSDLLEADGLIVLPHVGAVVLLAKDSERFYSELTLLIGEYCVQRKLDLDLGILAEVIMYQSLRFPCWPAREELTVTFTTNVAEYFQALADGHDPIAIAAKPTTVTSADHDRPDQTFADFAATLVRGGLTVDLLAVEVEGMTMTASQRKFYERRRKMEQRNLDKLKKEYVKIGTDSA